MWIVFALGASLFWGLTYVFNEETYKGISVFTALAINSLFVFFVALIIAIATDSIKSDISALMSSKKLLWYVAGGAGSLLIAELLIGFSIVAKNATLAGLIEISYPIFIALFGYFLFRHQVTLPTIIGGIIIFAGIFVIYYFNH